jgi:hypothetical protein
MLGIAPGVPDPEGVGFDVAGAAASGRPARPPIRSSVQRNETAACGGARNPSMVTPERDMSKSKGGREVRKPKQAKPSKDAQAAPTAAPLKSDRPAKARPSR